MQTSLQFVAPGAVQIISQALPVPDDDEVLVASCISGISAGTELLAYRGQLPAGITLDKNLPGLQKPAVYPFKYGYAVAGIVIQIGANMSPAWMGKRVFAFHPHESHFLARPDSLVEIPDDVPFENAIFLANMETAVSFLMDGQPIIGERVLVIGQGVVGLLTTSLLLRHAHLTVDVIDLLPSRRARAQAAGACHVYEAEDLQRHVEDAGERYDLVYELSGNPAGLNTAIDAVQDTGRIIVGSWYGAKPAQLDLGGRFHRSRARIYASQVSSIDPRHAGRWTKMRRLNVALSLLKAVDPRRLITHQYSIHEANRAYQLLDSGEEHVLQVILNYV